MGLADLKKNSTPSNSVLSQHQLRGNLAIDDLLDDFINDASRYASGQITLANQTKKVIELDTKYQHLLAESVPTIKKGDAPFRKATFTLSESAISHLAELANSGDVAKSKLIRFLVEHHFSLSLQERRQKEQSIIVD